MLLYFIVVFSNAKTFSQEPFSGSFLMTFYSPESDKDIPFLWSIQQNSRPNKMALEIQDDMLKKGVRKRVLFIPGDSTWTMLINFNKVKQGTRIQAAAMFRDTVKHRPITIRKNKEEKIIENYLCRKMTVESDKYFAEVWYTEKIKFDMCGVYRLLSHCGMMSEFVRKGDWFMNRKLKWMVMEVKSTNKATKQSYTMNISGINNIVDTTFFDINGYKIANIPEGQNCGVEVMEEN